MLIQEPFDFHFDFVKKLGLCLRTPPSAYALARLMAQARAHCRLPQAVMLP
jgi:hypothetical protein